MPTIDGRGNINDVHLAVAEGFQLQKVVKNLALPDDCSIELEIAASALLACFRKQLVLLLTSRFESEHNGQLSLSGFREHRCVLDAEDGVQLGFGGQTQYHHSSPGKAHQSVLSGRHLARTTGLCIRPVFVK